MRRMVLVLAILLMCGGTVYGQTMAAPEVTVYRTIAFNIAGVAGILPPMQAALVTNPTTLSFQPSADHDATALDGTPILTSYEYRVYPEAGGAVLKTVNLGKPAPVNGLIAVVNPVLFQGLPSNTRLIARVAAIGTDGATESDPSNPFGLQGAKIPRGIPTAPAITK